MKLLNKVIKILLVIVMLFTASIGRAGTNVKAATFPISQANLYSKSSFGNMLTYNGIEVLTTYVVYQKDGVEYPAYCIDPGIDGVGEKGSYTVSIDSLLNDVMLWRVVTNGYPYKTIAELGCNTKEEAYTATKQAIYSMIYGREANWYGTIGEQGMRVRNAMAQILSNARAGTSGKLSSNIDITTKQLNWEVDSNWKNYVSQTFEVKASTSYSTYNVTLEGKYPEETKILGENNQIKNTFTYGEKFKIAIPLKNLKQDGEFSVNVSTKLNTKPVFYGKAPNSGLQDYALTASSYEDATGSKNIYYYKNNTKLQITKLEKETLNPLKDVEFRVLDINKNPVYTNLVTNEKGIVELVNIIPGKYYLEEVKTNDGYVKLDEPIEFVSDLNQATRITVYNYPEKKSEYISSTQDITAGQEKQEVVVDKNNETSSIHKNEIIIDETKTESISSENTNINIDKLTNNTDISNKNENANLNTQTQNTNINNENVNTNLNTQTQNTNINNENVNTNLNTQNQNTNIKNENANTNLNTQNQNTNIENENINTNNNTQNENTNIQNKNENTNVNSQNTNTNLSNSNVNTNVNTQNQNINISNQNSNTNISNLNGVVKLPKTGM